ncbi:cobalamin-5-phosphate synthase [Furfurilactobacillus siliginis]|uniref:Adenosylcobinamide-GDP ribazoletransferase n=1 Tax=Furfurilactobacillus siliginis TaxID=348151 RepID=A0A0R2L3K6_9LACO|nr:cobalamin-5-phosphate synthase [Furfurilactobacillus siliginis]
MAFGGLSYLFPSAFSWMLIIIADGVITGGFHLDAWADTADAIFSSRTVDRMREIMKDSRLGTMGVLALVYYYAIAIGVGPLLEKHLDRLTMAGVVIVFVMMSKIAISLLLFHMHYAGSTGGLAEMWQGVKVWQIIVAQVFAIVVIVLLTHLAGLIAYFAVCLVAIPYRHKFVKLFGGLTGDTLGAFTCFTQLTFLLVYTGLVVLGWS